MSLLFRDQQRVSLTDFPGFFPRAAGGGGSVPVVSSESAMRHSAVWASRRLRADLISSLPVDVFRPLPDGQQIEVPDKPPVLVEPAPDCLWHEWMYSSQMDDDAFGNTVGLITARDAAGKPAQIELQSMSDVVIRRVKGELRYRIKGAEYGRSEVWHERQYTVPGSPVGLSPIAASALSVAQGISAQEFAARWYSGNAMPNAVLRNNEAKLSRKAAGEAKESFLESMSQGGVWATGKDWEFNPVQAQSNDALYLDAINASSVDVARFFNVPADIIDAAAKSGGSITYANITQRIVMLLVLHLGATINRREKAISAGMLQAPRFMKLNSDALLRMDPQSRSTMLGQQIRDRIRTPNEARKLENLPPLSPEDLTEYATAFGLGGDKSVERKLQAAEVLQKAYLAVGKVITSDEARAIANSAGADLAIPGPDFTEGSL